MVIYSNFLATVRAQGHFLETFLALRPRIWWIPEMFGTMLRFTSLRGLLDPYFCRTRLTCSGSGFWASPPRRASYEKCE